MEVKTTVQNFNTDFLAQCHQCFHTNPSLTRFLNLILVLTLFLLGFQNYIKGQGDPLKMPLAVSLNLRGSTPTDIPTKSGDFCLLGQVVMDYWSRLE